MEATNQQSQNAEASASADASVTDLLAAWEKVYHSIRLKLSLNANLVAADLRLSMRALVITLICIVSLVGLGITFWITLLIAICIGLTQVGMHWSICASLVLLLNALGIWIIKRQLSAALTAVHLKATCDALLPNNKTE